MYHIKNHKKLLNNCFKIIKKDGYFFAEDLILQKRLNKKELSNLSIDLYANYLPTYEKYLNDLEEQGFKIIFHSNMTDIWSKFVKKRKRTYINKKRRHIAVHGKNTFDNMKYFYDTVDKYFSSKQIGGIKVLVKK